MKANSSPEVLEAVRERGALDRRGQRQRGAARPAGRIRDGQRAAGGHVDRRRLPRQRADRGARARRAAQRRLARHDRRAARRRVQGPHRPAGQPGLRSRPRPVVRHRRPLVEARRLAEGWPRRALAAAAKLPIVALHAHVGTGPQIREFDANMRKLVDFYVDAAARASPTSRRSTWAAASPIPTGPAHRRYDLAWYRPVLMEAAGGWPGGAAGRSASRSSPALSGRRAWACWSRGSRT